MAVDANRPIAVEPMTAADADAVLAIYGEGIADGEATLETTTPDWAHWDRGHRSDCRFVARDAAGRVLGWAALSPYSSRHVYRGVAWESVYVARSARGRGFGRTLLDALILASEDAGVWSLQAGVLVENVASLALHERVGFRWVGVQVRVGQDGHGRWRDVVLMERRSTALDPPPG